MVSDLKIRNGKMYFIWNQRRNGQREAKIIIRNRLTKAVYHEISYSSEKADEIAQNGISCGRYGIPVDVPLEVASLLDNGEECGCRGGNGDKFGNRYSIQCRLQSAAHGSGKLLQITMPPKLSAEAIADLPEEFLYCEVISPGNGNICLYLPKLQAWENRFEIRELPPEHRGLWRPKLADNSFGAFFKIL